METFVDGCVADGNWSEIDCFQYYGLDSTVDDKLDWLGNAPNPATASGSTTKEAHDGYRKLQASANFIGTSFDPSVNLVNASVSDILVGVFMNETVDPGSFNVSPWGIEDSVSNDNRHQVMVRTNDVMRIFPLAGLQDSAATYTHPFSGEWMALQIEGGVGEYLGGVPGSVALSGTSRASVGTFPATTYYVGSNHQIGNTPQDGDWECVMTAFVVAKSTTFDLNAFSLRMQTFKAAVDAQP
jgi:hypothetical protein